MTKSVKKAAQLNDHSSALNGKATNYEWGNELHPVNISAWRKGDIWVVSNMGAYFYTDTMISKIAHVMDYHGEKLTGIRVDLEVAS